MFRRNMMRRAIAGTSYHLPILKIIVQTMRRHHSIIQISDHLPVVCTGQSYRLQPLMLYHFYPQNVPPEHDAACSCRNILSSSHPKNHSTDKCTPEHDAACSCRNILSSSHPKNHSTDKCTRNMMRRAIAGTSYHLPILKIIVQTTPPSFQHPKQRAAIFANTELPYLCAP